MGSVSGVGRLEVPDGMAPAPVAPGAWPAPRAEATRRVTRPAVVGWVLYDLANTTFALGVVTLYFSLWAVNVVGGGDAPYGVAYALSMAVTLLASPLLGALTDQAPRRMPFLVASTLVCVGATLGLGPGGLVPSLALFAVANVAYQAGQQFYDSLLPEVSTERNRGTIGGLGVGASYLGSALTIAVGGALLRGVDTLAPAEQSARYVLVFRASAVLFLLFALPCFLFVRERPRPERRFTWASVGAAARRVGDTLRSLGRLPDLRRFLIGRAFYTDAVSTLTVFMSVYVTAELGFTTGETQLALLLAVVFAVVGGPLWGRAVDRYGPKRTLDAVLALWVVVLTWTAAAGLLQLPKALFWPVPCLGLVALGGIWAADRPYLLRLTPPDRTGEFFGLYGMVGRFAAITGPLAWVLVADTLGLGRPAAVLTLLAFVGVSYAILRPVSDAPRDRRMRDPDRAVN
jgi:UMF1 family MFS transporter